MHNYIKELKKRLEDETDEHRRFLIQSTLSDVELSYKQRIAHSKAITNRKKEKNNMSKTDTVTQYAVFAKRTDGEWIKLNTMFYDKSETLARRRIEEHKNSFEGQHWPCEYKIMAREVTTITEEWSDVL